MTEETLPSITEVMEGTDSLPDEGGPHGCPNSLTLTDYEATIREAEYHLAMCQATLMRPVVSTFAPHRMVSERRIIGYLLHSSLEPGAEVSHLLEVLSPQHFYVPSYQTLFWACSLSYLEFGLVDLEFVQDCFHEIHHVHTMELTDLIGARALPGQEMHYVGKIREAWHRRLIVQACNDCVKLACSDASQPDVLAGVRQIMKDAINGKD